MGTENQQFLRKKLKNSYFPWQAIWQPLNEMNFKKNNDFIKSFKPERSQVEKSSGNTKRI